MIDINRIIDSIPLLKGHDWKRAVLDGWSNRSVNLRSGQQSYVLRIPLHPEKNHIDRCREYINLQSIASLNITKPTLYFDSKTGIQLRYYIDGKILVDQEMTDDILQQVAKLFHQLHDSMVRFEPINMFERLRADWESLRAQGILLDARYESLFSYCDSIEGLCVCESLVPCHMDPNLYNFILGERLWMIDFEYAHQYDRAWDLAYFITCARLTPKQEKALHEAYHTDGELLSRVQWFKPVAQLSQAIWVQQQRVLGQAPVADSLLLDWEQGALAYAMELVKEAPPIQLIAPHVVHK